MTVYRPGCLARRTALVAMALGGLAVSVSGCSAPAANVGSSGSAGTVDSAAVPAPTGFSTRSAVRAATSQSCLPVRLVVPSIGIDESVAAMGTNSQGQIYPPPHTTIWYDRSVRPGQDGIAVIAGHVTYDGPDNFYRLNTVKDGAQIQIGCDSGRTLNVTVRRQASISKTALTTDQRVWGASSTPVVTLITCDIASKVVQGHHVNNYVVWATLT
ncbi:sortase family protein [Branchiibius hedensis]|uniref:Sortase family protein n=2 Tax=Branchiibius hedensis TaxID=672460 RepID=A0A2Y8ZUA0_9MICO|nr:sortase family protein [Branchiibius hedensis]SSA35990.1 Sortase family protein [Branchiibius hedensis]